MNQKEIVAGIESYRLKKIAVDDTADMGELKVVLCKEFGLEPGLTQIKQLENKKEIAIPPEEKDTEHLFETYSNQIEGLQETDRGRNFDYFVLDYFWARELLIYGGNFEKVRNARLLLIGAGALGNETGKNLALSGIGRMTIVDKDMIENPNLSKSIFFRKTDVGKPKARILAERIRELVPTIAVDYFIGDVTTEYVQCKKCSTVFEIGTMICPSCHQPFDTFHDHERVFSFLNLLDYDLVVSCVDNFSTREIITRRCLELGIPLFDVGISGKRFDDHLEGNYVQLRNITEPEDPCICCLLSEDQIDLFRDPQSGADPCGLVERDPSSLSLMAIAASLQSDQVINFITGAGRVLSSLFINTTTNSYHVNSVSKNVECPLCSSVCNTEIVQVDKLEDATLPYQCTYIQFKDHICITENGKRKILEVKQDGKP